MTEQNICFIGCGNMATAIIGGLIGSGWSQASIMAANPTVSKLTDLAKVYNILTTTDNLEAAEFAEIIVLAVKPQKIPEVCGQLSVINLTNKLIISVAAGYSTLKISLALKQQPAIIRSMPNTPALIGLGATGLFANELVSGQQKMMATAMFNAVGQTTWISREQQMDVVTAIAGSSPAYFFLMMQAMVEQAVESGLAEQEAFELITQAASGAAQLAQKAGGKTLQLLRQNVTSPGGTTAAAIESFQADNFENIVKNAVKAAISRGIALGK